MLYTGFAFWQCLLIPCVYVGFLLVKNNLCVKRIVAWSTLSSVPLSVILMAALAQSIPSQGVPPQDIPNVYSRLGLIASYTLDAFLQFAFLSMIYIVFFSMIKSNLIRWIIAGLALASLPITVGIVTTLSSTPDYKAPNSLDNVLISAVFGLAAVILLYFINLIFLSILFWLLHNVYRFFSFK